MEFSPEQLFEFFAQTGSLIRFEPGTIFGNTNAHFGVVINSDPSTQRAIVVVCASSQIQKLRDFASSRQLSPNTIVQIKGGTHSNFGKDTAFDCNRPESVPFDVLASWHQQGSIRLTTKNGILDQTLLDEIRAGVMISDLVPDSLKDTLT